MSIPIGTVIASLEELQNHITQITNKFYQDSERAPTTKGRKCPSEPAKNYSVGDSMIGLDGYIWIVAQKMRGITPFKFWKKAFLVENSEGTSKTKKSTVKSDTEGEAPKRRGRPPKTGSETAPKPVDAPKKRGRPSKSASKSLEASPTEKKKRGRPSKSSSKSLEASSTEKKKPVRKCPEDSAKVHEIGDVMTGQDGREWKVTARPNTGTQYWKAITITEKVESSTKSSKKIKIKKPSTSPKPKN